MSFLDKVKDKIKGKSIDTELNDAFGEGSSYSKRVLEASQNLQKTSELSPDYFRERQPPAPRAPAAPEAQFIRGAAPERDYSGYGKSEAAPPRQPAHQRSALPLPADEDEFMRRRYDSDNPAEERNAPPPRDLLGLGENQEEKRPAPPFERNTISRETSPDASVEGMLDSIILGMKDLRAQNNHIIDLLRNIQDRLNRY